MLHALVRAKLLGLRLLTIEASVLIEPVEHDTPALARGGAIGGHASPPPGPPPPRPAPGIGSDYQRAIELLKRGTEALDRSQAASISRRCC